MMIRSILGVAVAMALLAGCGREDVAGTGVAGDAERLDTAAGGEPAATAPAAELAVHQAWTRAVPPNAPVAAGYLNIVNGTAVDDRLVSVRIDAADRAEIHEMTHSGDGAMQMRELADGLPVPGGISVDLRPGGLHLMFFGPDTALWQAGEHIPVTLVFEAAGAVDVRMEVFAPGEAPSDGGLRMRGREEATDHPRHGEGEHGDHHHDDPAHGEDDAQGVHDH